MKKNVLLFLLLCAQTLSAQGWVNLRLEGFNDQLAIQCADEGADGYIYGVAEMGYNPFFVKLDPDGELLASQVLPVAHSYSRFQKFGSGTFIGWGHNTVTVFNTAGDIIWSQVYADNEVKDVHPGSGEVLVLTNQAAMPYHILRFLADGTPGGDVSFQSATECLFVGSDGGNGYVAAGNFPVDPNNSKPAFLKIDSAGNVTQDVQLAGFIAAEISNVTELPGGGYAMIGLGFSTQYSGIRGHVLKVMPDLAQEWVKALPDQFQGKRVFLSADGQLVAVGWGMQDYFNAVKLDLQGNTLWSRKFFKSSQSILFDGTPTADEGFLFMGQMFGGIAFGVGRVLIKTDADGLFYSHTIKGKVYSDTGGDCLLQGGEPLAPNVRVSVQKNFVELLNTDSNGVFYALADTGEYEVKSYLPSDYWTNCSNGVSVQVGTPDTATVDLLLRPEIACPRMEVSIGFSRVRPCFQTTYHIRYANTGTTNAPGAAVLLEAPPSMTYEASSVPLIGQQGANGYVFGLGTVNALETGTFWVKMKASCDLSAGDTVCTSVHIFPDTICNPNSPDTTFFTDTWCRVVTASFDPNAKSAYPPGVDAEHFLAPGSKIGYLIDFQNTGTDTAENVIIYDTLSTLLDAYSVSPAVASHPYVMERVGEHVLKFIFRNIFLPDSNINEAASHGFIKYFVYPQAAAPVGSVILNKAAIYFDFNAPIYTNEYHHTLGLPVSAVNGPADHAAGWWSVSPNPAETVLQIDLKNRPAQSGILKVYRAFGDLYRTFSIDNTSAPVWSLDVSGWPAGAYFLTLETPGRPLATKKVVVLRRN